MVPSTSSAGPDHDEQKQSVEVAALSALRNWRKRVSTGMDQLLPGLFVGGLRDAMDAQQLTENGIKAIVSVHGLSRDCQFGPDTTVMRVMLMDSPGENVSRHFSAVNSFIHAHRLRRENVLVHCLAGVSRSVCLCVAYLMSVTNLDYSGALDYVSERRWCARPNFGFKMQLLKFGQQSVECERQRLFMEFSPAIGREFGELYRNDCIFTNSLFVDNKKAKHWFWSQGKRHSGEGQQQQMQHGQIADIPTNGHDRDHPPKPNGNGNLAMENGATIPFADEEAADSLIGIFAHCNLVMGPWRHQKLTRES